MIIRDLKASDRAQWSPLWAAYLAFYETTLAPEITDATFARLVDPSVPNLFGLVAEEAGALLGFTHCVLHPATWATTDHCYLEDLFTAPEARGRGVGRALIEAVYARADELNCARVYWHTHETNTTARALYDKLARHAGFIHYRR
ncbi:MAG: GNAT family N-acetyltransferase [Hyphomonadaceae bacterium]|nr:GNAT family N-acetyltransferase [Hyphomonadaceae bacterium]